MKHRTIEDVKRFTHRPFSPVLLMHTALITLFVLSMVMTLPTLG